MKLKNTLLASALLSATAFSVNAATELTPEQAAAVKPFDRVVVTGRFNAIGEAVKAVSRRADKEGAASFYVVDTSDFGNSGNWRVVADLYKADAEKAEETRREEFRHKRAVRADFRRKVRHDAQVLRLWQIRDIHIIRAVLQDDLAAALDRGHVIRYLHGSPQAGLDRKSVV